MNKIMQTAGNHIYSTATCGNNDNQMKPVV